MANQPGFEMPAPDDESVSGSMADTAERCRRLITEFLTHRAAAGASPDPFNIGNAFLEMTAKMMSDPAKMVQAQMSLWQDYLGLWQSTAGRML
ncbi:MAG: class I poly(R)-hydroxyalkanoic acid synthase, partial [Alphaproteobacteria bacterium]|nr:class I poly(R)-hydroxyalkanoic acid synthase [Alphaproteobacteria bacterium]